MKYLKIVFVLSLLAAPGLIWYRQTGDLSFYFTEQVPGGQFLYVLSKLAGLYALVLIALQIIATLSTRVITLSVVNRNSLHRWLGSFVIILAIAHLLLFFAAVSIRQDAPAMGLFLPSFKDYYHTRLSFGLFALWAFFLVAVAGMARMRGGTRLSRWLHRSYWIGISLVYLHALAVGTETQSVAGIVFYSLLGVVMLLLLVLSLYQRIKPGTGYSA